MGFSLPRVTRCCFCASLRTGALIIGYISCVISFLFVLFYIGVIISVSRYVNNHTNNPPGGHTHEDLTATSIAVYILLALHIALTMFYFIMSLLLIIGAHKQRPHLMKYYFIAGIVNLGLSLLLIIANFIFTGFLSTVLQLINCAIIFYLLLVVRSAYLEMEERQRPQPKVFEMNIMNIQQRPLMA